MKFLKYLTVFILGFLVANVPDFVGLHEDYMYRKYVKRECIDKGVNVDKCDFYTAFEPLEKEHPTLHKIYDYFLGGQGTLFYVLSGRCSHKPFHNASAAGEQSGKIESREYFLTQCYGMRENLSDFIFREKSDD